MGLEALMMNDLLSAAVCLLSGMMWELLASGVHTDHKSGENFCRGLLTLGWSGGHCWWECECQLATYHSSCACVFTTL